MDLFLKEGGGGEGGKGAARIKGGKKKKNFPEDIIENHKKITRI